MRRALWIGLAVVAALSLYVMRTPDDELLAPTKAGAPSASNKVPRRDAGLPRAASGKPLPGKSVPVDPWVSQALMQGVVAWQTRAASGPDLAGGQPMAWASLKPPAPVAQTASQMTPQRPVAPTFPHAWVGRVNDEALSPSSPMVPRAVLVGPQTTWVVRAGDVIEGQWRIDLIQDRSMRLTYLPLQQQQTVAMK